MKAAAIGCRSYYSLLRGAVSVERWARTAKEYGYSALAVADVNGLYGVVDFCKAAKEADIKPIVGAEVRSDAERVVLLAEDRRGYRNLCRIISARHLDEDFELLEQLKKCRKGLICIVIDGCAGMSGRDGVRSAGAMRDVLGDENLFAGCADTARARRAIEEGLRPIAWGQFNAIEEQDRVTEWILGRIRNLGASGGQEAVEAFTVLITEGQLQRRFKGCKEAIENNMAVANRCGLQLLNSRVHLPRDRAGGQEVENKLARLCHVGLARRYGKVTEKIIRRLEYELGTIRKSGFCDYFLVVNTIIDFAKRQGIPVDVRGSAAGSLVSYVLGFTRVCPIENNLYFERFMNAGRKDCPDIDIDLCWRRRDEVIEFCYENWGDENVAMIATLNRYRRRSAVRDAGRALLFRPGQISELAAGGASYEGSAIYQLAEKLIDVPRHLAVHCGGIAITHRPVRELAPLERAAKGVVITQYDKDAAEAVGLVKIDLLGNRSLSTVHEAVQIISGSGRRVDVDAVDGQDAKTAKLMSEGDSLGVFQCESPGMRQLVRGLKVGSKKDVQIALSLIRPGPAAGGMKDEFIKRHIDRKPFSYLHPKMAEVLGDTYGVMLYQEDVMRIAVEVAGYSAAEANTFRMDVSKKVAADRVHRQYMEFVYRRAEAAKIDRDAAEAIWDEVLRFAAYSYCKAHATVYANIAWQTAFLKAHYPREFYTSLFNNHQGMYPLRIYVWDAIRHGIKVLAPHVNYSEVEWSVEGKAIRAGLNIVKGLRRSVTEAIVRQRREKPFDNIDELRRRIEFHKPELEHLIELGSCDGLGKTRPEMLWHLRNGSAGLGEKFLFETDRADTPEQLGDYDRLARLNAEVQLTQIPFSMHPGLLLVGWKDGGRGRTRQYQQASRLSKHLGEQVTVAGFVAAARRAQTANGRVMAFVTLEDFSGLAEVSFFPDKMDEYQKIRSAKGPIWVTGKVSRHLSSINIECSRCGQIRSLRKIDKKEGSQHRSA